MDIEVVLRGERFARGYMSYMTIVKYSNKPGSKSAIQWQKAIDKVRKELTINQDRTRRSDDSVDRYGRTFQ